MGFATPAFGQNEEKSLLASAQHRIRTDGAAMQANIRGTPTSMGRVAIGLGMAAAGVAMLLIEPAQPRQPTAVSADTLSQEAVQFIAGTCNAAPISCEFIDRALAVEPDLRVSETRGVLSGRDCGAGVGIDAATSADRTVYAGPLPPFEERNLGLKIGGAALAIGGALFAALWSDVPVVSSMHVGPTSRGGLQLGSSVGF